MEQRSVKSTIERNGRTAKLLHPLMESGELIDRDAFKSRMRWTDQRLDDAIASGRAFHVEFDGRRYVPAFFSMHGEIRRKLIAVNRSLGDLPDTAKLLFFTSGKASLSGHTPLEALRSGSMPLIRIKACAQAYAQQ